MTRNRYRITSRVEKLTSAVQKIGISRHNGEPIKGPTLASQYDSAVMVQKVSGEGEGGRCRKEMVVPR